MSAGSESSDNLPEIWKANGTSPEGENVRMTMLLLREKQRSLRDLIQGQNVAEYLIALCLAPLTAFAAWKTRIAIMQLGYGIMTVVLAAGSALVWLEDHRSKQARNADLSVREYHVRLLGLYDRRVRFLKTVKFWYALPLFFGAALASWPIAARILPRPWGIVLIALVLGAAWLEVWRMNDVRRVRELRHRRKGVEGLLEAMDASC